MAQSINNINEEHILENPSVQGYGNPSVQGYGDERKEDNSAVYAQAYAYMIISLEVQQKNFLTKANSLKLNANTQLDLLDQQKKIKYRTDLPEIPDKSDPDYQKKMDEFQQKMDQIQLDNQNADNAKAFLQNTQATLKQSASVMMAETNAAVNSQNQKTAMTTGFTRALNTIAESIANIIKPN